MAEAASMRLTGALKAVRVPVLLWLGSRLVLLAGLLLAGAIHSPDAFVGDARPLATGWELFAGWDSEWYRRIVMGGYAYHDDGAQHSIAFFPLYPLLVRGLMDLCHLAFVPAAVLLNNAAFFVGAIAFYRHVLRSYGRRAAAWSTAVLCFYPYSLFASMAYTEGLLLMLIVLALSQFEAGRYKSAWLFGALATATKIVAAPLVPAFLVAAWVEKRGGWAWAAAIGALTGLLCFAAYCAGAFGDPLAFVHVQKAWRGESAVVWKLWAVQLFFGGTGLHQLGQPALALLATFGGGHLLFARRHQLKPVDLAFGCFALLLLFAAGPMSCGRLAFVIVPLAIALGLTLGDRPRTGFALLGYFALALAGLGAGWAYGVWIA